ncbi:hypothetical protein JKP88DRAFT_268011 [Tribonema minus]|uniref:Uncharacterized protein n=1 Tax=Tribonema minus TaxID=303371 RepID=A0A836CKH6_9STRA|nr:hypothetical protein JKP88DRAFT_268011 [Tribonema minus]
MPVHGDLAKVNDPNAIIEIAAGPPAPTLVPQKRDEFAFVFTMSTPCDKACKRQLANGPKRQQAAGQSETGAAQQKRGAQKRKCGVFKMVLIPASSVSTSTYSLAHERSAMAPAHGKAHHFSTASAALSNAHHRRAATLRCPQGLRFGGRYADIIVRFIFKKAHMSNDDFRLFNAQGRLICNAWHQGKNPVSARAPLPPPSADCRVTHGHE